MKKLFLLLGIIVIAICLVIYKFFPSYSKVMNSNIYAITQTKFEKSFKFDVFPDKYLSLNKKIGSINADTTVYNGYNTKILFEMVKSDADRIHIIINSKIKAQLKSGQLLTLYKIEENNGQRSFANGMPRFDLINEAGKKAECIQCGSGPSEIIVFTFMKSDFFKEKKITVTFKDYWLTSYKSKIF